ncbi:MAG: hypothetical protein C5B49_12825 [Bdellovibrio sp.]|nr:MAG: hypothetical protein C5B49_12825 [Bdellovibrio sp.]
MDNWDRFPPYVPVAERRARADKAVAKMAKQGKKITPVRIEGRAIAKTFWGKAWCDHLESFSDYENRLPRGRTYVRNGSVVHLEIDKGSIEALVQGSSLYKVKIRVDCVDARKWRKITESCSGEIDSVIELLQGKLSSAVMKSITDRQDGLFPLPHEISLDCSCPDWAEMCKHVAAVLYGVGAKLDEQPDLLFKLRHVDHLDLITKASLKRPSQRSDDAKVIKDQDLSGLFGIEIEAGKSVAPKRSKQKQKQQKQQKKTAKTRKEKLL